MAGAPILISLGGMRASAKKYPQRVATATNDIAEAYVESLNYDGSGVAHIDGKVTFIEDALPGETLTPPLPGT